MTRVLIDTCGWVAVVDAGINVDIAMRDVVGSFEPVVLTRVLEELRRVQENRSSPLLLDLLMDRAEVIDGPVEASHPDDQLVILGMSEGWPTLTVDKGLKQRLAEIGAPFVEVVSNSALRLVEV